MDGSIATPGHNSQAATLLLIDIEKLRDGLNTEYAPLLARLAQQEAAFDRFRAKYSNGLPDEDAAGLATDWAKQLAADAKAADQAREYEKAPALAATRSIDGWFKAITDTYGTIRGQVLDAITAHAKRKMEAERQARIAEAKRQQEEAERLAAQAEVAPSAETLNAAVDAEQRAIDTAAAANTASAADLSRTRGDLGSVASLRTRLVWEVTDLKVLVAAVAAGKAPLEVLAPDKAMLDALLKRRGDELRALCQQSGTALLLPGVPVTLSAKAVVR